MASTFISKKMMKNVCVCFFFIKYTEAVRKRAFYNDTNVLLYISLDSIYFLYIIFKILSYYKHTFQKIHSFYVNGKVSFFTSFIIVLCRKRN